MDASKKDGLDKWKARVGEEEANRIMNAAANRGTIMHNMCEKYLLNEEVPQDPHPLKLNKELFNTIKPIIDTKVQEVYGVEFPLYSHRLKTAGMCDFFCLWDGKKTVLDFKTSSARKYENWIHNYFIQETVYAMCLWEIYGIKVDQIVTLIAVDHDKPQIFVKDPLEFMPRALQMFKEYHKQKAETLIA